MDKQRQLRRLSRRGFLLGLGALSGIAPFVSAKQRANRLIQTLNDPNRDFSVHGDRSLPDRARAKGLLAGAFPSVGYDRFSQEPFRSAFMRECDLLVCPFFWSTNRPTANTFDLAETDDFFQFALKNGLSFQGNSLIWNQLLPEWLLDKLADSSTTPTEIEEILIKHVSTIVKRYAGKVHSWSVVNEAIWPEDRQPNGFRETPWLKALGETYIDIAFHAARAADPHALLFYNSDRVEHDSPDDEERRVATLNMLKNLKSRGVPIQALGIQSHLVANRPFDFERFRVFLSDVANLGLKILISELDVNDSELPGDIETCDRIVASVYENYLSVVLEQPAVIAVSTWGIRDRDTWLDDVTPRSDGRPLRPLPLDSNLRRKLAWNGIARSFDRATKTRALIDKDTTIP